MSTHTRHRLTSNSKYFSPAFSPDGKYIIAVEIPDPTLFRLVVLDSYTGKIAYILYSSTENTFSFPRWTEDGKYIIAVAQNTQGNALVSISIKKKRMNYLTDYTPYQMANPFPKGKYVYFQSSRSGIDNIYALDRKTKDIFQITSTLLGAYQPYVSKDGTYMFMSEFSEKGYDIKKIFLLPEKWKKINPESYYLPNFHQAITHREGGNILNNLPETVYPTKSFQTKSKLFNFHTLQPIFSPPNYGLNLLTQNEFSTFSGIVSGNYNSDEKNFEYGAALWYGEYYPVIKMKFSLNSKRNSANLAIIDGINFMRTSWEEKRLEMGIFLPINLSKGIYTSGITVDINYNFIDIDYRNEFLAKHRDNYLNVLNFSVHFINFQRRAQKHINPRWGQSLQFRYHTTFATQNNYGNHLQIDGVVFLPGFFRSHSFSLSASIAQRDLTNTYAFPNIFRYPRNYPALIYDEIQRFSLDYALPICYPDLALGSFFFIKRVRTNLFYDIGKRIVHSRKASDILRLTSSPVSGTFNGYSQNFQSTGIELIADMRVFRLADLSIGVRYGRLLDADIFGLNSNSWRFIIAGINF